MTSGFQPVAAQSKRSGVSEDAPTRQPMRPQGPRAKPSREDLKIRREQTRKSASIEKEQDVSQQREAQILQAMAVATPAEQQRLALELEEIRGQRRASLQADRDLALADTVVAAHRTPVAIHTRNTSATDWIATVASGEVDDPSMAMKTEASLWFNRLNPEVRADREEFGIQARGMARRMAGRYGEQMPVAERAFLDHAAHLYRAEASKTADVIDPRKQNGQAESEVAVYDTLAPVTEEPAFDEGWASAGTGPAGVHPEMPGAQGAKTAAVGPGTKGAIYTGAENDYEVDVVGQSGNTFDVRVVKCLDGEGTLPVGIRVRVPKMWVDTVSQRGTRMDAEASRKTAVYEQVQVKDVKVGDVISGFADGTLNIVYKNGTPVDSFRGRVLDIQTEHIDRPEANGGPYDSVADITVENLAGDTIWHVVPFLDVSTVTREPADTTASRKTAGNPYPVGTPNWFAWESGDIDPDGPGRGPIEGVPQDLFPGGVPLRGDLTPEQQAWLKSRGSKTAVEEGTKAGDTLSPSTPDGGANSAEPDEIKPGEDGDPAFDEGWVADDERKISAVSYTYHLGSEPIVDPAAQSGEAESNLEDTEVGDEGDVPAFPWEMEQNTPGTGAADVADVPTPGTQVGAPQPTAAKTSVWISVPDPDGISMPLYEGDSMYAGGSLQDGTYAAVDEDDQPVTLTVSGDGLSATVASRKTAVSLTNVGIDPQTQNGVGTDPSGNRVQFRLSDSDRAALKSVLYSDLAMNFSGVDVTEDEIIRESAKTAAFRARVQAGLRKQADLADTQFAALDGGPVEIYRWDTGEVLATVDNPDAAWKWLFDHSIGSVSAAVENQGMFVRNAKMASRKQAYTVPWEKSDPSLYESRVAQDAARSGYGGPDYARYLDQNAKEQRDRYLAMGDEESAARAMGQPLDEALRDNNGD